MKKAEPDRAARLADALRANLRRRKAQARETGVAPTVTLSTTGPESTGMATEPDAT